MADEVEQTDPPVQDPAQAAPPAPPAPPPPTPPLPEPPAPQAGPWANDLQQVFQDEATRAQVDTFLREKVQPYTTQLEQKTANLADAERLYNDLASQPYDTYVAITQEMFGPEAAQAMIDQINQAQQQAPQQPQGQEQPAAAPLDPRVEAAVTYAERQQQQQYYDSEMARIEAEHPGVDVNLLHPFVAAAGGDFNQAYDMLANYNAEWIRKYGTPAQAAPEAPPVLSGDSATAPPVEPKKQTLDEALNDFMAEQRANKEAPPVT